MVKRLITLTSTETILLASVSTHFPLPFFFFFFLGSESPSSPLARSISFWRRYLSIVIKSVKPFLISSYSSYEV